MKECRAGLGKMKPSGVEFRWGESNPPFPVQVEQGKELKGGKE